MLPYLFVQDFKRYTLTRRAEATSLGEEVTPPALAHEILLRWARSDPYGRAELLALSFGALGFRYSNPALEEEEEERLRAFVRTVNVGGAHVLLRSGVDSRNQGSVPHDHVDPDGPDGPDGPVEEDHWVEIQLIDDKDEPVANIPYEIRLSDGRVRRGVSNAAGVIRYERLPGGNCELKLTGLDKDAWEPL